MQIYSVGAVSENGGLMSAATKPDKNVGAAVRGAQLPIWLMKRKKTVVNALLFNEKLKALGNKFFFAIDAEIYAFSHQLQWLPLGHQISAFHLKPFADNIINLGKRRK